MPSNHIYQIEQDPSGFMWFPTNMGVVRFDGHEFRTFTTRDGLPSNDIWRLEATDDGRMWYIAQGNRLGYISRDSVYSFPFDRSVARSYPYILIDKNEVQLAGEAGPYAGIYALKDGRWQVDDIYGVSYIRGAFKKWLFFFLGKGRFIIFSNNRAFLIDRKRHALYEFKGSLEEKKNFAQQNMSICKQFYFPEKQLFFIMNPYFVSMFNIRDSLLISRQPFDKEYAADQLFWANPEIQQCGDRFQISRANEWILVDDHLNVLDRREFSLDQLPIHVFKDRDGNFWTAGHDYGVDVFPKATLNNRYHFPNKKIQTLQIEQGQLFMNIFDEGWYRTDPRRLDWKPVVPNKGKVYGMGYHDSLNSYYFYTNIAFWYGKNLNRLQRVQYVQRTPPIHGSGAKCLLELPHGYFSVGVGRSNQWDEKFRQTIHYDQTTNGRFRAVMKFADTIYVGGYGLHRLMGRTLVPVPGNHPLLEAPVTSLLDYDSTHMLVGTDGFGAYLYKPGGSVIPLKDSEGYSVTKLLVRHDTIWMATGNGVHRFTRFGTQHRKDQSLYEEDGLLGNNVNDICIVGNRLFIAQDNGLVETDLDLDRYRKPIKPYFMGREFYNKAAQSYTLPYGNNISLSFGILGFPSQRHMRYFYRTDPDEPWTPTTTATLLLGKQPPGRHTVSYTALDQHGNVGRMDLLLVVSPLWYQTWAARIGFGLAAVGLVVALTLLLRKRSENRKKEELQRKKTLAELELKALRSQMNPHFVFNSLNAIQYYIIKNKTEQSEEYLAKFSHLVRMFFEYSKYDSLRLSQEIDLLRRYLEIEKLRFEDKLDYSIESDPEIDEDDLEVPSMIFQPIVENAINHGIFHKKGNGRVDIRFTRTGPNAVRVSVTDNGVGILAMKEIQKDATGNYKSKSSEVIRERLKILSENRSSKWMIEYKIVDRSTQNSKETGTLVEILLIEK